MGWGDDATNIQGAMVVLRINIHRTGVVLRVNIHRAGRDVVPREVEQWWIMQNLPSPRSISIPTIFYYKYNGLLGFKRHKKHC